MRSSIEIEADHGNRDMLNEWLRRSPFGNRVEVAMDGSLSQAGVELKPNEAGLTPRQFVLWVSEMMTALASSEYGVTPRCGLHMHFDRESVPFEVWRTFLLTFHAWAFAVKNGRPGVDGTYFNTTAARLEGQYCFPIFKLPLGHDNGGFLAAAPVEKAKQMMHRTAPYSGLDEAGLRERQALQAWSNHFLAAAWSAHWPTVEIRVAAGTLDASLALLVWERYRLAIAACKKGLFADDIGRVRALLNPHQSVYPPITAVREGLYALGVRFEDVVRSLEAKRTKRVVPTNVESAGGVLRNWPLEAAEEAAEEEPSDDYDPPEYDEDNDTCTCAVCVLRRRRRAEVQEEHGTVEVGALYETLREAGVLPTPHAAQRQEGTSKQACA